MSTSTVLAVYFLIWWITLFAVLPFGMTRQAEASDTPGVDPGAPLKNVMWRKLGWTTLVATIIFVIVAAIYMSGIIKLDWLIEHFGPPKPI